MVTAALWSDVDGDGWPDLIVAYDWGQVACYRNLGGKKFEDISDRLGFGSGGTGRWSSLASCWDFNGDEKAGLTLSSAISVLTRLITPLPAEPTVLYAGVSVEGSAPQLVEAQSEAGRWYPLRNRETLLKVFPALARRFPTAESYAKATLEEVFPPESLSTAVKFAATELRSGVLLSQPDGTYRFSPLPRLAQIAPIEGLAAGDFDGDGCADILLVGNLHNPIPEIGRFDGGLGWLLRGDGRGGFTPAAAAESGFVVPGDARALAVTDLDQDGWPDALVTRNNDRALLFLNHPLPGRHGFGIALQGPPGNPTAIGARLTLTLADGTTQTAEVGAGTGYFAQSSSTVFFGYTDVGRYPCVSEFAGPTGERLCRLFLPHRPNWCVFPRHENKFACTCPHVPWLVASGRLAFASAQSGSGRMDRLEQNPTDVAAANTDCIDVSPAVRSRATTRTRALCCPPDLTWQKIIASLIWGGARISSRRFRTVFAPATRVAACRWMKPPNACATT